MPKEPKIQKKVYVAPEVRNVVSNRTMDFSTNRTASMGIVNRAAALDYLYGDTENPNYGRNRERIRRAMNNMFAKKNAAGIR